jgi:hypothetical protein
VAQLIAVYVIVGCTLSGGSWGFTGVPISGMIEHITKLYPMCDGENVYIINLTVNDEYNLVSPKLVGEFLSHCDVPIALVIWSMYGHTEDWTLIIREYYAQGEPRAMRVRIIKGYKFFSANHNAIKDTVDNSSRGLSDILIEKKPAYLISKLNFEASIIRSNPSALVLSHLALNRCHIVLSNLELLTPLRGLIRSVGIFDFRLVENLLGLSVHLLQLNCGEPSIKSGCNKSRPCYPSYALLGAILATCFSLRLAFRCFVKGDFGSNRLWADLQLPVAFLCGAYGFAVLGEYLLNCLEPFNDSGEVVTYSHAPNNVIHSN